MIRVAIPTFKNRVSPVIDSCTHMLIVDIARSVEMERENVFLGDMSLAERFSIVKQLDVRVVICGGISEAFATMLKSFDVQLIDGIVGDIDVVLSAFKKDQLNSPTYYMPGFKSNDKRL